MNEIQADFPAAHSMDTSWFAIDKTGKLGLFESGEDGAVPKQFTEGDSVHESGISLLSFFRKLRRDFYVDDLIADTSGFRIFERISTVGFQGVEEADFNGYQCLAWFKTEIPRKDRKSFVAIPHSKYCLGWARELSQEKINRWIESGVINRIWLGMEPVSHRSGFYLYENDRYGGYPYQLIGKPSEPLVISQLPQAWQKQFRRVAFKDVDFQYIRAIQPIEHVKCDTWSNSWIDMNGNVHEGGKNL